MPLITRKPGQFIQQQVAGISDSGEAFSAGFGEAWATGPLGAAEMYRDLQRAEDLSIGETILDPLLGIESRKLSPKLSPDDAKQRVKDAGLEGHIPLDQYPNGIRQDTLKILIDANTAAVKRATIMQQSDGWAPQIGGMLLGSLVDPVNVATAFIPVVGEARYAKLLASASGTLGRTGIRVGAGAIEGAVGAAIVEPIIYAGQQQWRNDYTAYDSFLNVAGGALFGSLLHAGTGLVKDAFGHPVAIPDIPKSRQPFADPDAIAAEEFQAQARRQGISVEIAKKLTPKAARDDVTGYFDGRQSGVKAKMVQRAIDHAASGEPSYFVSADISNLGGLNAHVGNVAEAANVHFRGFTDILAQELRATGADIVPMRTGGDELGMIVVNASQDAMDNALDRVADRVAIYAKDNGLSDIPHPKRSGEKGVGLHAGIAKIDPGANVSDVINRADIGVDASKRGLRVRRETPQPDRIGLGAGERPGRMAAPEDGRIRPKDRGFQNAQDAVRPFIAQLDPQTQATALRHAIAQDAQFHPVDVTPAMLMDKPDQESMGVAMGRAAENAKRTNQSSQAASQQADRDIPDSTLDEAKNLLADDEARYKEMGGDEIEFDGDDLKMETDAVKAATLCMMRTGT